MVIDPYWPPTEQHVVVNLGMVCYCYHDRHMQTYACIQKCICSVKHVWWFTTSTPHDICKRTFVGVLTQMHSFAF